MIQSTQQRLSKVLPNTGMNQPESDLNYRFLQLQFTRLDIILHRQVERVQALRLVEPSDTAPGHFGIDAAEAFSLLQRPFGQVEARLFGLHFHVALTSRRWLKKRLEAALRLRLRKRLRLAPTPPGSA